MDTRFISPKEEDEQQQQLLMLPLVPSIKFWFCGFAGRVGVAFIDAVSGGGYRESGSGSGRSSRDHNIKD